MGFVNENVVTAAVFEVQPLVLARLAGEPFEAFLSGFDAALDGLLGPVTLRGFQLGAQLQELFFDVVGPNGVINSDLGERGPAARSPDPTRWRRIGR